MPLHPLTKKHCWHPYDQAVTVYGPLSVEEVRGTGNVHRYWCCHKDCKDSLTTVGVEVEEKTHGGPLWSAIEHLGIRHQLEGVKDGEPVKLSYRPHGGCRMENSSDHGD